jgi:hypothetical protein
MLEVSPVLVTVCTVFGSSCESHQAFACQGFALGRLASLSPCRVPWKADGPHSRMSRSAVNDLIGNSIHLEVIGSIWVFFFSHLESSSDDSDVAPGAGEGAETPPAKRARLR